MHAALQVPELLQAIVQEVDIESLFAVLLTSRAFSAQRLWRTVRLCVHELTSSGWKVFVPSRRQHHHRLSREYHYPLSRFIAELLESGSEDRLLLYTGSEDRLLLYSSSVRAIHFGEDGGPLAPVEAAWLQNELELRPTTEVASRTIFPNLKDLTIYGSPTRIRISLETCHYIRGIQSLSLYIQDPYHESETEFAATSYALAGKMSELRWFSLKASNSHQVTGHWRATVELIQHNPRLEFFATTLKADEVLVQRLSELSSLTRLVLDVDFEFRPFHNEAPGPELASDLDVMDNFSSLSELEVACFDVLYPNLRHGVLNRNIRRLSLDVNRTPNFTRHAFSNIIEEVVKQCPELRSLNVTLSDGIIDDGSPAIP